MRDPVKDGRRPRPTARHGAVQPIARTFIAPFSSFQHQNSIFISTQQHVADAVTVPTDVVLKGTNALVAPSARLDKLPRNGISAGTGLQQLEHIWY